MLIRLQKRARNKYHLPVQLGYAAVGHIKIAGRSELIDEEFCICLDLSPSVRRIFHNVKIGPSSLRSQNPFSRVAQGLNSRIYVVAHKAAWHIPLARTSCY